MQNLPGTPWPPAAARFTQHVVGHAEAAGGEQVLPVAVVGERSRLAHQPVDDVPVVDPVLAASTQPRQLLHLLARTRPRPARRTAGPPPARRSAGWAPSRRCPPRGSGCPYPPARAAACTPPDAVPATARRRQFLGQPLPPARVQLRQQLRKKRLVVRPTRAKSRLPRSISAWSTARLNRWWRCSTSPFSLALPGLDRLPCQPVVPQQGLIARVNSSLFAPVVHRRRQPVGAMFAARRPVPTARSASLR